MLSRFTRGGTDKYSLDKEVLVLMIDETEEQHDVVAEYFDEDQLDKEKTGNLKDSKAEEIQPPNVMELLDVQIDVPKCTQKAVSIGLNKSIFTFHVEVAFVRIFPTDNSSQQYMPATLRPQIFRLCHFSILVRHPGDWQVYKSIRQHCYWLQVARVH